MTPEDRLTQRVIRSAKYDPTMNGWDVTFQCGHQAWFAIAPAGGQTFVCAQCVNEILEEHRSYKDVELYAWIGVDDSVGAPRTDEIGLKQARCPAGWIPMVAVRRDKMEQDYIVKQMEDVSRLTGVPRVLARFKFAGVVRSVGDNGE